MAASKSTSSHQEDGSAAGAAGRALLIAGCYLGLVALAFRSLLWVPPLLGPDAPVSRFSEARALQHAAHLAEGIGNRQVGTPGVEAAAQYVLAQAAAVASLANAHPHMTGGVEREQASGGLNALFAGVRVASAYRNLTNVVLHLAPRLPPGRAMPPALLLNSHFDSVFGTQGASDCGACVGVMLEVARSLAADPGTRLAAPLVLLFNGGEEALLLAAHGFMQSSRWAPRLGAFLNLESTGPGGPAYLFRHTGGWTLDAYARAAAFPHGSVVGQDFFETRLLSMDTDFRMFSAAHEGSLPGIDIAYILDGTAYHTDRDTVARIRRGTVQASGDNIRAAALELAAVLGRDGGPPLAGENAVFFDFLGWRMVSYPWSAARRLHTLPLTVLVVVCVGLGRQPAAGVPLAATAAGAGLAAASVLSALLAGAAAGVLRALLSGKALVWFGRPLLFGGIYAPAAAAGLLLPHALASRRLPGPRPALLGAALLHAGAAAALTAAGARSGFLCAGWALAAAAAAYLAPVQGTPSPKQLAAILAALAPAGLVACPLAAGLPLFVAEHISLSGSPPPPAGWLVGDAAVGVVVGLAVAVTASVHAPLLAPACRRLLPWLVAGLALASAAAAAHGSRLQPYSPEAPKRVLLQHHHQLDARGRVADSRWALGGLDPVPIETVLPAGSAFLPPARAEWQALYPVSRLLRGVALPAPGPDAALLAGPEPPLRLTLERREPAPGSSGGAVRLHLLLRTARPPWGSLNVSGPVRGWSFTEAALPSSTDAAGRTAFMVRFASNDAAWPFWVDVAAGQELGISAAVLFMGPSEATQTFAASLPAWTNAMPVVGFQADFSFAS